jgi:superfamily II DNA or RNA helicase
MIALYKYQIDTINQVRHEIKKGHKRIVLCSPTGSGKTVMFSYMVQKHIEKGGKAILFTHRSELLNQSGGTFENFGLKPHFIKQGIEPDLNASLHIAMVETFNRRKIDYAKFINGKTLVIFDEAHLQNFTKIMVLIPESAIVIGATATPFRPAKSIQMADFYSSLVQVMDTQDVINLGKLTPAKSYGIEIDLKGLKKTATDYNTTEYYKENKTYIGVVKNYERHSKNDKTILFASNIKSSKEVCNEFKNKGYNAKHIDGKTPKNQREDILSWFANTDNAILCNCGILTAGFDQADIKTVILYRATTSLPLFLQMCGRGSRIAPNKDYFKILDFGNNIDRLGFWEDKREWRLSYERKRKKEDAAPKKICPKCDAINPVSSKNCIICKYKFPIKPPTIEEVVLIEYKKIQESPRTKISQMTLEELIVLQKSKRFSSKFIWRVVRSKGKEDIKRYSRLMGYSYGWVIRQLKDDNNNFTDVKI